MEILPLYVNLKSMSDVLDVGEVKNRKLDKQCFSDFSSRKLGVGPKCGVSYTRVFKVYNDFNALLPKFFVLI